jgi:DNA-binding response OmpR family regulator
MNNSGMRTVLIVEDDDVLASSLRNSLTSAGYSVRRAGSAEEALVMLHSTPTDLILMNLLLPDSDGLMLCATLRAHFAAPVIMLSNRWREVDRALALQSGAVDSLTQSVNPDELLARVESIVLQYA